MKMLKLPSGCYIDIERVSFVRPLEDGKVILLFLAGDPESVEFIRDDAAAILAELDKISQEAAAQ